MSAYLLNEGVLYELKGSGFLIWKIDFFVFCSAFTNSRVIVFLLGSPVKDEDDAIDVLDDDDDKEMLSAFRTHSISSTTSTSSSETGSSLITLVGWNSSIIVILSTFETVNDKYKNKDN